MVSMNPSTRTMITANVRYCTSLVASLLSVLLLNACVPSKFLPVAEPSWVARSNTLLPTQGNAVQHKMAVDGTGNSYLAGRLTTTTVTASDQELHTFVLTKINSQGQLQWQKSIFQTAIDAPIFSEVQQQYLLILQQTGWITALKLDAAGNIYFVAPIMPNPDVADTDWFVAKYDPLGNLVWQHTQTRAGYDIPHGLEVTNSGGVYVYGNNKNIINELSVTYYDTTGKLAWRKTTELTSTADSVPLLDISIGMSATQSNGNLYLIYRNHPDINNNTLYSDFIAKYTSAGVLEWQKEEIATPVNLTQTSSDTAGNVYIAKRYYAEPQLQKRSSDGTLLWKLSFPTHFYPLTTAAGESYVVSGKVLQKYSSTGTLVASKNVSIVNQPYALTRLASDSNNRIYIQSAYIECPPRQCDALTFLDWYGAEGNPLQFTSQIAIYDANLGGIARWQTPIIAPTAEYFFLGRPLFYGINLENVYGTIFESSPAFDAQDNLYIGDYARVAKFASGSLIR